MADDTRSARARELHNRHAAALHRAFAEVSTDPAHLVAATLDRFLAAASTNRDQADLLLCRVAFETLAETPDDPAHTPTTTTRSDDAARQAFELAFQALPPRQRAALTLYFHTLGAAPDLDLDELDPRIATQLVPARAHLHALPEAMLTHAKRVRGIEQRGVASDMTPNSQRRLPPLFTLLLVACATEEHVSPIEEDDAPRSIARAFCDLQHRCGCPGNKLLAPPCESAIGDSFVHSFADAQERGLTYDPECVSNLIAASDANDCTMTPPNIVIASCGVCKLYYGSRALGETCGLEQNTLIDDCAADLRCAAGICVDPCEPVAIGGACQLLTCVEGASCVTAVADDRTVVGECVPTVGMGESCEAAPCAASLVCDPNRSCIPTPDIGEPCNGTCAEGAWCDDSSTHPECRARLADGEYCERSASCVGRCSSETSTCGSAACFDAVFGD